MACLLEKAATKAYSAAESWKVNAARNTLQIEYAKQWNAAGIDVLLCPANASVASAHTESTHWGYTSAFNSLDFSAAVFPVGTVQDNDNWDDYPRPGGEFLSEQDRIYQNYYDSDGPRKYQYAPVSLQLVTRRFTEERLLATLDQIVKDMQDFQAQHISRQ